MREAQIFCPPPLRASKGRYNLNRKFKTFGFLDTLKVHIYYKYTVQLPYIGLLYPANKTSRKKNSKSMFLILFTLQIQI